MIRLVTVLVLLAALVPAGSSSATAPLIAETSSSTVRVGVANAREGSFLRSRADLRDATDRRRLADRLLGRGLLPDVVLLQEVLGSAGRVASALTHQRRAVEAGVVYRVLSTTSVGHDSGSCAGPRSGRFPVLRSSAIVVNTATVTEVLAQGTVRTWGRWNRRAWSHTLARGYGCTAHPWARLEVTGPGGATRNVLALDVHLAPQGERLKTAAVPVLVNALQGLRTETDQVLVAGDFNLSRCPDTDDPEPVRCRARQAHRALTGAGYVDAVRFVHPDGPDGTAGIKRRVEFLYTDGTPLDAWHDRCYRGFRVARWWPCPTRDETFSRQSAFQRCVVRSTERGSPGRGCRPARFQRFYSDHPALVATIG